MSVGESPPTAVDPLISQVVAERYRIIRKLGEGGMGSVYLAEHIVIEKKFALKMLAPELCRRPDLVARFLQEARSASRIGHENVIDISDFGQSPDGLVFIAMEFLDGQDLGALVRSKGAMDWRDARDIVLQICRALRAAHDKGIVHRDMKPENIFLIQREGQPHFVKILDFGIAKVMGVDPNGPRLTRTGMIFGTPEYMAPEQAEGKDTDHRADIYAVGCIIYHLLTGQTPFVAESFMTMLTKHLMEDPVAPSVRRPDLVITPEMDNLVLKALEKDRDKRWQSMAELMEAVAVCPGPADAALKQRPGQTIEMGGANAAAALKVLRAKPAVTQTDRIQRTAVEVAVASAEAEQRDRPRRTATAGRNRTVVLVAAGVALGVAVAIALAVSLGKPSAPASPPTTVATPTPPAVAPPPPPVVPTPPPPPKAAEPPPVMAVEAVTETESGAKKAGHGRKGGKGGKASGTSTVSAVPPVPASPVATPPSAPKPGNLEGLKPFPTSP